MELELEVDSEIDEEVFESGSQVLMSKFCVLFVDQIDTLCGSNKLPNDDLFELASAE